MSVLSRRLVLAGPILAGLAAVLSAPALAQAPTLAHPVARAAAPLKIGVVGSGRIGSLYGEIWSRAGHQVMFSDRDPATARAAAARSPGARSGTAQEAAAFGDVVLLSVPYAAMPDIARDLGPTLRGKVVIDTGNPNLTRDGDMARAAIERGAGLSTAAFLPGAKVVRAFNILNFQVAAREAGRPGERLAVPVAGDDPKAVDTVMQLVRDAGLEPLRAGDLAASKKFDLTPAVQGPRTAAQMRPLLGL